jgi:uncharacterized protein YciI
MELDQCYVVFLRKGPIWTADEAPELDALQEKHLEHLNRMAESGKMAVAGPIESLAKTDLRGISIFYSQAFASLDELKTLVEQDPMIQIGRLVPEYYTWYFPKGRISFGPTL